MGSQIAVLRSADDERELIEAMAERSGQLEVQLPNGKGISIDVIKKRYENLAQQWGIGLGELLKYIYQEMYLGIKADEICKNCGFNVVLFGHTHDAKIDKDWFFIEDRIYANTGFWCGEKAHCVIIDKSPIVPGLSVDLVEVDINGNIESKQHLSL